MLSRDEQGRATLAGRPIANILAEAGVSTPAYIYDVGAMVAEATALERGFHFHKHLIAYAVKANSAGPVVRALADAGCGAEVGSLGELKVALNCGIAPEAILFNGVAKTDAELDAAIGVGGWGVMALQLDCVEEVARVDARAKALDKVARISLRLNPNIEVDTHAHIATGHDEAKFGITLDNLPRALDALTGRDNTLLVGLSIHIGSQLTRTDEYLQAADLLFDIVKKYEAGGGHTLELLDLGGGFGIDYGDGCEATPADFARGSAERAKAAGLEERVLVVEPGRSLVGPHGVLVSKVVAHKRSGGIRWMVIDAGMNDLMRPALYQALHRVEPLQASSADASEAWRVVGPVCESSCDFGNHDFAEPLPERVLLRDAGAYGYTMASNYNGRGLPAEIFVMSDGKIVTSHVGDAEMWAMERITAGMSASK